jgi:hypothetical protein
VSLLPSSNVFTGFDSFSEVQSNAKGLRLWKTCGKESQFKNYPGYGLKLAKIGWGGGEKI